MAKDKKPSNGQKKKRISKRYEHLRAVFKLLTSTYNDLLRLIETENPSFLSKMYERQKKKFF